MPEVPCKIEFTWMSSNFNWALRSWSTWWVLCTLKSTNCKELLGWPCAKNTHKNPCHQSKVCSEVSFSRQYYPSGFILFLGDLKKKNPCHQSRLCSKVRFSIFRRYHPSGFILFVKNNKLNPKTECSCSTFPITATERFIWGSARGDFNA